MSNAMSMRRTISIVALGGCAWLLAACQGPTLPLSAQQGSSILVPIGNADTVSQGLIGFGGTLRADPQRGEMKFYLDSLPPTGIALTTQATSIVEASRQSVVGRSDVQYPYYSISPYMVVSLVNIPASAPIGTHDLFVIRQRGTEPAVQVPYMGKIKILPSPTSGIAGQFSEFRGAAVTGQAFYSVASYAPDMIPNPMVVIGFDPPVHAVELAVYIPAARIDVLDVIDPPHADRTSAHPALVRRSDLGSGYHRIAAIASRDDLPLDQVGVVFELKANQAPLTPDDVVVAPVLATDESGADMLPLEVFKRIE